MEIIQKSLSELKMYANNPRHNESAVDTIAASIKEFGFKVPLLISASGEIICGHTRYKAAQLLGLDKIPCIIADDFSDEQIRAFRLVDNKTAELASWDLTLLEEELSKIADIDMSQFDFSIGSDDAEEIYTNKATIPDYESKDEKSPVLSECYDCGKTETLISNVDKAEIPADIKRFLRYAAMRHVVFDYGKIAEYYTHAPAVVQELMEQSALVIIDYDRAIMDGYVNLHEKIDEIIKRSEPHEE